MGLSRRHRNFPRTRPFRTIQTGRRRCRPSATASMDQIRLSCPAAGRRRRVRALAPKPRPSSACGIHAFSAPRNAWRFSIRLSLSGLTRNLRPVGQDSNRKQNRHEEGARAWRERPPLRSRSPSERSAAFTIRICTDSEINGTEKPQRLSLTKQEIRNHPNDASLCTLCRPRRLPETAAGSSSGLRVTRAGRS